MDIYGALDLFSVLLALVIAYRIKTFDLKLLVFFFALSSIASFFLFETEYFKYWFYFFTPLCFIFGLLCKSSHVALGYMLMLVDIGVNQATSFGYYSQVIYLVFYWQLWKAAHDHSNGGIRNHSASHQNHQAIKG